MTADTKAAALADELEDACLLAGLSRREHLDHRIEAAALIRTQAARIAELEAERAGLVAVERERCAALCSKAMPQPVANWSDAQIVESLRLVREAILSTEAKP